MLDALKYLQENEPQEGYYVGFSGGKDSIVTLELCRMAGVKHKAYYSCTRIDPPEVVQFIRKNYPDVIWLFPSKTFYEAIQTEGPPLRMQRWCCDTLKKDPGKKIKLKHRVLGLRAEESNKRSKRPRTDTHKKTKQILYKPIFHWSEYHVWEFINEYKLSYPSLYDDGFHRIGCVICPFIMGKSKGKRKQREVSMERWPGMWKAFENSCREWFKSFRDEEIRPGQKHKTFEAYYQAYLDGFE
jgi:phosphoadenosine phosphosulfate reductase